MKVVRLLFTIAMIGASARSACAAPPPGADELEDQHVRAAIAAIVAELYARKDPVHFWDPARWNSARDGSKFQGGGYTALTVLALLHAGQSYQDPRLRDAVDWLAGAPFEGTYAVAQRAQVWAGLPESFQPQLDRDIQWLMDGFSAKASGWWYDQNPRSSRSDNSLRQYGVLAMWEAAKRGRDIGDRFWRMLEETFLATQRADGGWNYRGDSDESTGSMTAAGLTVLYITQDLLHGEDAVRLRESPAQQANEQAIARGLTWMSEHYEPARNPGALSYFYYYSYGIERVGLASGWRRFGAHDWFRDGCAELLERLCEWDPDTGTMSVRTRAGGSSGGAVRTSHLAFALMYLSRGRVPVAINKLEVPDLAWNNRPRDAAKLSTWLGDATESELNWQVVRADADPRDWLDAAFLYLASHRPVPDDDALVGRLRRYLDLGGLLLAVNEGSGRAFAQSIEDLGSAMYPDLAWRDLPEDHWIYTLHAPVDARRLRFRALGNGVRELIVLAPFGDPAASWQVYDVERKPHHFDAMANLYLYASEMDRPRARLDRLDPTGTDAAVTGHVRIARAVHAGAWNAEPLALERFAAYVRAERGVEVDRTDVPLAALATQDPAPHFAMLSGVAAITFTSAELAALRAYCESGGLVVVETTGGLGDFTEGVATQLAPLGAAHGILRDRIVTGDGLPGGQDTTQVAYRPFALERWGTRESANRLRGIDVNGHVAIVLSDEDLGQALLDQPRWGVSGYAPAWARRIMMNVVAEAMEPP